MMSPGLGLNKSLDILRALALAPWGFLLHSLFFCMTRSPFILRFLRRPQNHSPGTPDELSSPSLGPPPYPSSLRNAK